MKNLNSREDVLGNGVPSLTNGLYPITSPEYAERVYAGVLGKIIGVYLGRPFEQWSHERIERELGEITYYVHEKLGKPLIVTDDDISGTFTFLRALPENGNDPNLTPAQIGDWWLNTIIEDRTILWWGGIGVSTEHTAYLRLKSGFKAPESGSIALNGVAVAEEIGAQIFIDGWGMICPGDPKRAVDWARRAGSVSHDCEAIYGAQVVAALVALAFVETDIHRMVDLAAALIPKDSLIAGLIADMKRWVREDDDWRVTLRRIHEVYPYSRFGTGCPMVSNHAIVLLALLHGNGDFSRSLTIVNTAGYDTDCNSGNVGCILGVLNGLAGIDNGGPDWRGPIADRLYLPTADGGRAITDAVRETYEIVNAARALNGEAAVSPKNGARFHFSLPDSVQAFQVEDSPEADRVLTIANEAGKLALRLSNLTPGIPARAATATFASPAALALPGYSLMCSPTLYSGQTITAKLSAEPRLVDAVQACLYVRVCAGDGSLVVHRGESRPVGPNAEFTWTAPDTGGQPIAEVGVELTSSAPLSGTVLLDSLTWVGAPNVVLSRPADGGEAYLRAWVNAAEMFGASGGAPQRDYRLLQNAGIGLALQGERSWRDYTVSATVRTHLADRIGLVAAFQGLRRYVALVLDSDKRVRLIQQRDDDRRILAESDAVWAYDQSYALSLALDGEEIVARFGERTLHATMNDLDLSGAIGMLVETGRAEFGEIRVCPIGSQ